MFHLRQPMTFLFHSSYGMPGLAPLMNVLFWGLRDFHISFSNRDVSGNVWIRLLGSSMVDKGISSNNMKSPSPKCYMTFWDMILYSDSLHRSGISLNHDLVTELDLISDFDLITKYWEVSIEHFAMGVASKRKKLTLLDTWSFPVLGLAFILMLRPFAPKLVMSSYFEYRTSISVLLFCLQPITISMVFMNFVTVTNYHFYHLFLLQIQQIIRMSLFMRF